MSVPRVELLQARREKKLQLKAYDFGLMNVIREQGKMCRRLRNACCMFALQSFVAVEASDLTWLAASAKFSPPTLLISQNLYNSFSLSNMQIFQLPVVPFLELHSYNS